MAPDERAESRLLIGPHADEFTSKLLDIRPFNHCQCDLHRQFPVRELDTQFQLSAFLHRLVAPNCTALGRKIQHDPLSSDGVP